jgi:hypothetical protein
MIVLGIMIAGAIFFDRRGLKGRIKSIQDNEKEQEKINTRNQTLCSNLNLGGGGSKESGWFLHLKNMGVSIPSFFDEQQANYLKLDDDEEKYHPHLKDKLVYNLSVLVLRRDLIIKQLTEATTELLSSQLKNDILSDLEVKNVCGRLKELGYTDDQIKELRDLGLIRRSDHVKKITKEAEDELRVGIGTLIAQRSLLKDSVLAKAIVEVMNKNLEEHDLQN